MSPFLPGVIAGAVLALLHFFAAGFYSSRIISRAKMTSAVLVLMGFFVRLTLLGVIFYGFTKIKWIHLHTCLITFVISFTLCMVWKAIRVYREAKPLAKQQTEM